MNKLNKRSAQTAGCCSNVMHLSVQSLSPTLQISLDGIYSVHQPIDLSDRVMFVRLFYCRGAGWGVREAGWKHG